LDWRYFFDAALSDNAPTFLLFRTSQSIFGRLLSKPRMVVLKLSASTVVLKGQPPFEESAKSNNQSKSGAEERDD